MYRKFLRFAITYANPIFPYNWKEVIGFLYGYKNEEGKIIITAVDQMHVGHSVTAEIPVSDTTFIDRIEQKEYIIGWIHSHPSFGLFLSSTDIFTQELFEQLYPDAIALVIDPTLITKEFPGIKAFHLDDEKGVSEISLEISNLKSGDDFNAIREKVIEEIPIIQIKTKLYKIKDFCLTLEPLDAVHELIALRCNLIDNNKLKETNISNNNIKISYNIDLKNVKMLFPYENKEINQIVDSFGIIAIFRIEHDSEEDEFEFSLKNFILNYGNETYKKKSIDLRSKII